ncbi:MAG: hypothetical protein AAB571_13865 [Chloroflexota bacterium]
MNNSSNKMNRGLIVFLDFLEVAYTVAAVEFSLIWFGLQTAPAEWQRELMPVYAIVSGLGALSVLAILSWHKWGVYGLIAVWVVTALAYLLFAFPVWHLLIAGMIVVGAFVILIRPIWKRLI